MNFEALIERLVNDTTQKSLGYFSPELAVCVTIVGLLLLRLFSADRLVPTYWLALLGTLAAFGLAFWQFDQLKEMAPGVSEQFFGGMLVYDTFTVFFRLFLLLFLILVIALTVLSGIPDVEDGPDFYTLLLGAVVGMMLMASANHLLMLFLGIEMASVPSYVMVGFMKGRRLSSEAALKFVIYGAGAAGVMLYGISLLAGLLGTADLQEIAAKVGLLLGGETGMSDPTARTVVLAVMLVLVGLFFKLSLVPFHFWCPDAFEGAPAEVAGFLSVASKAAAFALLVRFVLSLVGPGSESLAEINLYVGIALGVVAAVTTTFGNLAAYAQTNVKRLLAYSTIAHAGYMLMAVAAMLVILSGGREAGLSEEAVSFGARRSLEGLLYYLAVYLFMNLGAFAIVAMIRNYTYSEQIDDYAGLVGQAPVLCVCMLVCLFSLIGMPPTGGFFAKWIIFWSLFQAGYVHWIMWAILVIGGLNTVIALFYYLRVLKAMFLAPRPLGARRVEAPFMPVGVYTLMVSVPVLALGIFVDQLSRTAHGVAAVLIR
jgi:NADH-quinone oxidoreductase subunit N